MRGRYLVSLFLPFLLLAACRTQRVLCPADSTTDIDAAITQVTNPVVHTWDRPFAATVEFAITVTNRTNEPMRVRSITLTPPHSSAQTREALQQCFALERVNADVATVSQGFDRAVAPGASATFTLRTRKGFDQWDPLMDNPTVLAVDIRTESPARTRSDHLTRQVTFGFKQSGKRS